VNVDRELRLRFHVAESRPGAGDQITVLLAIDSMRSAMSTPHGRQVYDTRRQTAATYTLSYSRQGGRPDYSASPAAEDFASVMGGPPPISLVLDRMFPPLPDSAIAVGAAWERSWTERGLEAMSVATRRVHGRFTLVRVEERDGARLARIEVRTTRAADAHAAADSTDTGALESTGTILLGVEDGVVREVTIEERVTGSGMFPGGLAPFRQTTRYRLTRVGGAADHGASS
jgi:hypothetical protein